MEDLTLLNITDFDLDGKKVFIRSDLNVPIQEGSILNSFRIKNALPTLRYALEKGAKVILASHLGRPEGVEPQYSLNPIADVLSEMLDVDVFFEENILSDVPQYISRSLKKNQIILLENLRFHPGEINNSRFIAQILAKNIDIYINDAFGVSHRRHMSVDALPCCVEKKGIGFLMKQEMEYLNQMKDSSESPFVVVLGGGKVKDKLGLIENLIDKADKLIIGGAMSYVFLKAMGAELGNSKVEIQCIGIARELIEIIERKKKKLFLPKDHLIVPQVQKTFQAKYTKGVDIPPGWQAVDIGSQTCEYFSKALEGAKVIFWNGPMGIFEIPEYSKGTRWIAERIASQNQAFTVIGGGDSVRAVNEYDKVDQYSYVSTGGGASLSYIQGKMLPGIESVKSKIEYIAEEYNTEEE